MRASPRTVGAVAVLVLAMPLVSVRASHSHRCFGKQVTIIGGPAGEVLFGTEGPDVIAARGGDDTIFAAEGNDRICGGRGNDTIFGSGGTDRANGGRGTDSCEAERKRKCE